MPYLQTTKCHFICQRFSIIFHLVGILYSDRVINITAPDLRLNEKKKNRTSIIFPFQFHPIRISSQGNAFLDRGRESRLVIDNVTYDYQGEYECRAGNYINGQDRSAISDPIALQVVGAPQVIRPNPNGYAVSVRKGETATLSLVVCADPRPRHVAWEWGSLRLEAGAGIGMYFMRNMIAVMVIMLLIHR